MVRASISLTSASVHKFSICFVTQFCTSGKFLIADKIEIPAEEKKTPTVIPDPKVPVVLQQFITLLTPYPPSNKSFDEDVNSYADRMTAILEGMQLIQDTVTGSSGSKEVELIEDIVETQPAERTKSRRSAESESEHAPTSQTELFQAVFNSL